MVHTFHFLPTSLVFEIENPFSWIFNAISSERSCLSWLVNFTQDTRIFPAYWILIGQFKFPARQPYARRQKGHKIWRGLYSILTLLLGSHWENVLLTTLKPDWAAFHSVKSQLKCLHFQPNQYKKLVPVFSRFGNAFMAYWLWQCNHSTGPGSNRWSWRPS